MEQHEVSDQQSDEEYERPLWIPPLPPEPEPWSLQMVLERFGFLLAVLGVGLVFGLIYLNADWLLREPVTRQQAEAPVATSPTPTIAAASESVALTIFSDPTDAQVFVDGIYVGVTPLVGRSMEKGTRMVSVRKEAFATSDTVITVEGDAKILQFDLQLAGDEEQGLEEMDEFDTDTEPALGTPDVAGEEAISAPEPTVAERKTDPPPTASSASADDEDSEEAVAVAKEETPPEPEAPAVGALQVTSQPSGATVFLGEKEVGVTPVLVNEVETGSQQVKMQMDGFDAFSTTVTVKPGERTTVNGRLEEALGTLRILAKPWGAIYIDGELHKKESTVWYTAKLQPGQHRVRVEHPALGKWEQTVTVSAQDNPSIVVDFNKGSQQ